ncbi:MobF family relaxase [Granulibacter bethesdensis]|nr:MobF family relaxase [Granulibacter bethesdensis]
MVATISALTSAGQAASYYEADDYYAEGGLAPSEWLGQGAQVLDLAGAVDHEQFARLLEGHVAGQSLGTMREGEWEHRPGWDVTFSAPKSVSIMAEVAGDRRLIAVHERAVKTALGLAEQHFTATRLREDGSIRREATGNLVIASFRHGTSRALDPQLHTHNVILNMTRDKAGQWRSLEPRAFYQMQKLMGAVYRQELAAEVQRLGYAIERGKDSTFEIAGIGTETLEAFSQRSAAIEARLAERGKSRDQASAAEKQVAALDAGGGRVIECDTREARFAQIAQDYASLDTKERRKALVIEPSREGRDVLTKEIRHRLAENGALHGPTVETARLVPRDLTRAEAKDAHSYAIGDTIRFAKDYADKGVSKAQAYRVVGIDTKKAALTLADQHGGAIDWRLRQWGASHSQAFTSEVIELRAGDQVQFTRNDRVLGRINGQQGEVIAVDPATREAKVQLARGKIETLALDNPRDQHIAHSYVATAFAAQGRTAERTFIHADSAATNLLDQKSFYVALSRAKDTTAVYTNDRGKLVGALLERAGLKQTALAPQLTGGMPSRAEQNRKAVASHGVAL